MKKSVLVSLSVLCALWIALPAAASTIYTVSDGGIDTGFLCTNGFLCGNGSETFVYDPPPPDNFDPASGTITLDTTNGLADISLTVASSTFLDDGGADNGIDEVVFTNVTYSAIGLTLTELAPDTYQITGAVSISGTYEQLLGGANVVGPAAFAQTANIAAGLCSTAGGSLVCGFDFGPGLTNLPIGSTPVNRKLIHTFNIVAVPEPGTALLLTLGVVGIAARRLR